MIHSQYIEFKIWADSRIDKMGVYNRSDNSLKEEIATILSRDYQKEKVFVEQCKQLSIQSIIKKVNDLKETSFAYVCNVAVIK